MKKDIARNLVCNFKIKSFSEIFLRTKILSRQRISSGYNGYNSTSVLGQDFFAAQQHANHNFMILKVMDSNEKPSFFIDNILKNNVPKRKTADVFKHDILYCSLTRKATLLEKSVSAARGLSYNVSDRKGADEFSSLGGTINPMANINNNSHSLQIPCYCGRNTIKPMLMPSFSPSNCCNEQLISKWKRERQYTFRTLSNTSQNDSNGQLDWSQKDCDKHEALPVSEEDGGKNKISDLGWIHNPRPFYKKGMYS